ncbi:MAG TPA: exosortase V [Novosphingobium sp.]
MSPESALTAPTAPPALDWAAFREALLSRYWPLLLGLAAMAIPSLVTLGRESWSQESGAHGPIVLATGLWLLWQVRGEIAASAGKPLGFGAMLALLVPIVLAYAVARPLEVLFVEIATLYAVVLVVFARFVGLRGILRNAFPFIYLAFLIPLPGYVMDFFTVGLREGISAAATGTLSAFGYPIAREGVSITIAQYQLLVEDACSGINSIIGLTAISLFYIYILHRASWKHAGLLIALILPIAVFANFIRVIVLILLTYYFGDAVGQGFAHNLAGVVLFGFALALMAGADWLIRRVLPRARQSDARA